MSQNLPERSILITGCSSGIGLASVRTMKARGWRVFASARKESDLLKLEKEERVEACHLDYTDPSAIKSCAAYVLEKTDGKLSALFQNGAYGQPGAVEDVSTDVLRAQFETNFFGWHDLTRHILPAMRKRGCGRLVFCSSILGLVSAKYRGAYCASKFALEGLIDSLRLELRGSGLHVSTLEPGPIESRFLEHALEAFHAHIDVEHSLHREAYQTRAEKIAKGGDQFFKLGPEAVAKKLLHALESKHPKPHYYITIPTYVGATLRRLLPTRLLDYLLAN